MRTCRCSTKSSACVIKSRRRPRPPTPDRERPFSGSWRQNVLATVRGLKALRRCRKARGRHTDETEDPQTPRIAAQCQRIDVRRRHAFGAGDTRCAGTARHWPRKNFSIVPPSRVWRNMVAAVLLAQPRPVEQQQRKQGEPEMLNVPSGGTARCTLRPDRATKCESPVEVLQADIGQRRNLTRIALQRAQIVITLIPSASTYFSCSFLVAHFRLILFPNR